MVEDVNPICDSFCETCSKSIQQPYLVFQICFMFESTGLKTDTPNENPVLGSIEIL